jgi:ArsR family metal-binding transcriptional regulator
MEIFKLLDKSNCRECRETTCLAFAAAVFKGQKQLDECPHLESDIVEQFGETVKKRAPLLWSY